MGRDRARRSPEESFTILQSGHLLYYSEANNGQAGVGFPVNKKRKENIARLSSGNARVAKLVLHITYIYQLKIVQIYMRQRHLTQMKRHTTSTTPFIRCWKSKQITQINIVMGDFNAKVGGQTNTSERATGCFGLGQRNERGDYSCRMGNIKEFQDYEHTISEESREEIDMEKP